MKRLLDYLRLRSIGFNISKAWELSRVVGFNVWDKYLATIVLILIVTSIAVYLDIKLSAKYYEYYYSALQQQALSEQYKNKYQKYENVVLGCLANRGIIINNVNHECLIRPYRESL